MLVLHGVFGLGTNFRAIARTLAAARPSWGFVLVDLRGHGASQGLPPPHDLSAAAGDLEALIAGLSVEVRGVMGHSFGGKVTLAFLERRPDTMDVAVVLDSNPGPRAMQPEDESALSVLAALESLPPRFASREVFQGLLAARGFSAPIIEWLTMNVRRQGDDYTLRLDLPAIRALLVSYFNTDLWHVLEDPRSARALGLVVAGRSTVLDAEARARAARIATENPRLTVTDLPEAGHWLHVDDPRGTCAAVLSLLDRA